MLPRWLIFVISFAFILGQITSKDVYECGPGERWWNRPAERITWPAIIAALALVMAYGGK